MAESAAFLWIAKALISIAIVVGLSVMAERLGSRAAGLLIGLPLGAGMVVVFTGLEQGTAFTAKAAGHMVPSFVTTIAFIYAYALLAVRADKGGWRALILPGIAAHLTYAVAAFAIAQVTLPLVIAVPMIAMAVLFGIKIMAGFPDKPIVNRVRFGWGVLMFRAAMAALVIVIITGIAEKVGPQWTGILTAYPITLYPLILVLHITYAGAEVASVLKHVPSGLASVISFCITVALGLETLGLLWGMIAAYAVAFSMLLILSKIKRRSA